jgi:glucuronate isomerase
MRTLGPDTGFDSIGDFPMARSIARFMDRLDNMQKLAKTILYNINPRDNELMATMIGNFQDGSVPGKIQCGAAWWFLDQRKGMIRQLDALSAMGLLSQFIGMLTDSRSFLSYPRHEYFRRILCALLGDDMSRGLLPDDLHLVGTLVQDVSYNNVRRYLALPALSDTASVHPKPSSKGAPTR